MFTQYRLSGRTVYFRIRKFSTNCGNRPQRSVWGGEDCSCDPMPIPATCRFIQSLAGIRSVFWMNPAVVSGFRLKKGVEISSTCGCREIKW